ncbi:MAG: glycosyltransferase family 87 protein [Acidobacteriota bacterium]
MLREVNPYLYPPPFLLVCAPLTLLSFSAARWAWLAIDLSLVVVALGLSGRILARAFPTIARSTIACVIAVLAATFQPIYDGLIAGQVNALVLVLILLALDRLSRSRDGAAGAFLGAAAIVKMSPALLLVWLVVTRRWRAIAGAAASMALLSLLSLAVVPISVQRAFYLEVLPGFSSTFPAVRLPISYFGNHSLPSAIDALLPSGRPRHLSGPARVVTAVLEGTLLAIACLRSARSRASLRDASAFLVLMVAFPVFAFDHHVVYLLLPIALGVLLVSEGQLAPSWIAPVALSWALLGIPLTELVLLDARTGILWAPLVVLARRAKLIGMGLLLVVLARAPGAAPRGERASGT